MRSARIPRWKRALRIVRISSRPWVRVRVFLPRHRVNPGPKRNDGRKRRARRLFGRVSTRRGSESRAARRRPRVRDHHQKGEDCAAGIVETGAACRGGRDRGWSSVSRAGRRLGSGANQPNPVVLAKLPCSRAVEGLPVRKRERPGKLPEPVQDAEDAALARTPDIGPSWFAICSRSVTDPLTDRVRDFVVL